MGKQASRLLLEIVNVKLERLQDISESDARRCGIMEIGRPLRMHKYGMAGTSPEKAASTARYAFADAWDSIYAERGQGWRKSPWAWAIMFKKL